MNKYTLNGTLHAPYQVDGVKWMNDMEHQTSGPKGGFLCDEMGVGKTIQIIATMLMHWRPHTLIVVPKTIVTQWSTEISKFAPGLSTLVYDGPGRTTNIEDLKKVDVVLCPYSLVYNKKTILHAMKWDRVVLDEAHEIRNRKSETFKAVYKLDTDIRWLATGTPVFNSMEDFVSLCMFLGFSQDLVQAMYDEIRDIYILRRTKADNIGKLPRCHFENVELEMYDEERRVYEQAFFESQEYISELKNVASQEYISELKNVAISIGSRAMQILECLLRVRQTMTWPQLYLDGMTKKQGVDRIIWQHSTKKMDTLTENVSQHPEEKSVIFCQFRGEMDHIEHMFRGRVFRIDGMVEKDERHARLDEFKNAPDGSVLVVQIKCGGVGLNIQCASRVYIMAPSWNPATELQAIGRCHRTGQTREVYVKKYLYTDTPTVRSVDLAMMALQGHKAQVCAEVLNDERVGYQIPVKYEKSIDAIRKIFR